MRSSILPAIVTIALVTGCSREVAHAAVSADGSHHVVKCAQPLPEFSLGPASTPTPEQQTSLCTCIWGQLAANEREVAEKIVANKESELSSIELRAFPSRFGNALEQCNRANPQG